MQKRSNRADSRKYHYIYKIVRNDGYYYIGMHSTDDLDDGYFGSGQRLWFSIKRHGIENHSKHIIEFCNDRSSLRIREKELVNIDLLKDHYCMNLCEGGQGWNSESVSKAAKNSNISPNRNRYLTASKAGKTIRERNLLGMYPPGTFSGYSGKKHTKETKEKMSLSQQGKHAGEKNSQFGSIWINNGLECRKIKKDDIIPDGWYKGRKLKI